MKRKPTLAQELKDYCRRMLADVELYSWGRCRFQLENDNTVRVITGRDVAIVNMDMLKRELSAENFRTFRLVFEELLIQAQVASYAVHLAEVEIGEAKRLADQLPGAIAGRKRHAKSKRLDHDDAVRQLQREADQMRKKYPQEAVGGIRAKLTKIPGFTQRMVREVVIAPRSRLPRPKESR